MSEVTAVPLRPIAKGSLLKLWTGIGLVAAAAVGVAYVGTSKQVTSALSPEQFMADNASQSNVKQTSSGLQYQVIKEGEGGPVTPDDIALVDYRGTTIDGAEFDSNASRGEPVPMPVRGVIPGFGEALQLMQKGSEYRFWIPPSLGYGEAGVPNPETGGYHIPPNAVLVFDVKVHEIQRGGFNEMMSQMQAAQQAQAAKQQSQPNPAEAGPAQ